MHESILKIVSDNPHIARYVYGIIKDMWPQVNERTKVAYTNQRRLFYAHYPTVPLAAPALPPDTLKRWWDSLFTFRDLDNPDSRWQYQRKVFRAIGRLPLVIWKTITGQSTLESFEYHKSMIDIMSQAEEITLSRIGWEWFEGGVRQWGYIFCAYHPLTDTLYVKID